MDALIKYFENRKSTLDSLLVIPKAKFTSGTFHKLRLEIKKLNALFELVNFCVKDFKRKKTFEPFKLIFKQAGKVRELQLQEARLKKYLATNSLNDYLRSLKKQRLKERALFFQIVNENFSELLKLKYEEILISLSKVMDKKANLYLEKKEKRIIKLLEQSVIDKQELHELRKQLKMLGYNLKYLVWEKQKETTFKKVVLPELIGKWHDCEVMNINIDSALKIENINPEEVTHLENIKRIIDSDSELLHKKINTVIAEQLSTLNKINQPLNQKKKNR